MNAITPLIDNRTRIAALSAMLLLAACGGMPTGPAPVSDRGTEAAVPKSTPKPEAGVVLKRGGGYYKDDGPGDNPPPNLEAIPDAVPKAEPIRPAANRPYTVLGSDYVPQREVGRYKARGLASWYGKKFHGQKTSTGEIYDMYGMTAAHTTLPIPSYARVTNLANGKSVVVRVNDRGPFHADRIIDLSYTAAYKLGYIGSGSSMVEVESIVPGEPLPDVPPTMVASKVDDAAAPAKVADAAPAAPATAAQKPLPEIDDARGAWLQLGAFGSRDNAEALKSRLARELGGDMGDKLVVRPAGSVFRVQLGPWADATEARSIADKLAESLQMKPMLVHK